MKIEKLNKDNIKEFIRDMKLDDNCGLELEVNKIELYGIKKDDAFLLGFNSLNAIDTIAILYYASRISDEEFYDCIQFLDNSLVVENHLVIDVYDEKYMKLLDDKYKCRELTVSLALDGSMVNSEDISGYSVLAKEKFVDVEMRSIKYYAARDMLICNLVKQNIQDEKTICDLHYNFVKMNVKYVNFTIFSDGLDYFKNLGYQCMSKSYIIN